MSDLDMSQYLGVFIDEAEEQIQQLDETIVQLEKKPDDLGLLNTIFRAAHTLKGAAASMGFDKLSTLTHRMENVLDNLRAGKLLLSEYIIDILLASLDKMKDLKENIIATGTDQGEIDNIVADLENILSGSIDNVSQPQKITQDNLELDEVEKNVIRSAEVKGYNAYEIKIVLEPDCQMKSARVYLIFNNLKEQGEVIKSIPHTRDLEKENFDDTFTLVFVSPEDIDILTNIIKSISEIKEVKITPIHLEGNKEENKEQDKKEEAVYKTGSEQKDDKVKTDKKVKGLKVRQTVRVDVQRLETLMNLVGELVIDRTRLLDIGNGLKVRMNTKEYFKTLNNDGNNIKSDLSGNEDLLDSLEEVSLHIGRITSDLQEEIMKARMFPIDQVFNRFPRMVRNLAQKAGKEIEFNIEGRETELDRTVIEEIGDPLIHLLRNAIDHGIETPEERLSKGKDRKGKINLKAYHQENQIVITVEDDGAGIDAEKIKAKAIEKGLISTDNADRLSQSEALNLIFLPGFSTSRKITDVSGRGVGMDIVRNHIEKINGTIDISTTPGKGTCFIIKLPLTLAINHSLLTRVGKGVYAFPLTNVVEIIDLKTIEIQKVQGRQVAVVRGRVLPLVYLGQALGVINTPPEKENLFVVIVGLVEKQVGFIVDNLIGEQEIVIKSLGNFIGKISGIAGATILGDGSVALILDIQSLINHLGGESGRDFDN